MKYIVVYKHPRNGAYRPADNGKTYANHTTALRHLHLCEMKKNNLSYEVMAIPYDFTKTFHYIMSFLKMDEEEREYFRKNL